MASVSLNTREELLDGINSIALKFRNNEDLRNLYIYMQNALNRANAKLAAEDETESKEHILAGWNQACKEILLAKEGKITGKPAHQLIDEL